MHLFFDTETSSLPDRRLPFDHPLQPRLVQLGCILADEDYTPRAELALIVRPDGTVFDPDSVRVHGIEESVAQAAGLPMRTVLDIFRELCSKATTLVAHNIAFDLLVMRSQFAREGLADPTQGLAEADTMILAQDICQIEARRGDGFKPPTLSEAYAQLCRKELVNAHDALADCRACFEVFREIEGPKSEKQLGLF